MIGTAPAPCPALLLVSGGFHKSSELGDRHFGLADVEAVVDGDFVSGPFIPVARVRAHLECTGRDRDELEFRARDFNAGFPQRRRESGMGKNEQHRQGDRIAESYRPSVF